jgi:hypothetical protein
METPQESTNESQEKIFGKRGACSKDFYGLSNNGIRKVPAPLQRTEISSLTLLIFLKNLGLIPHAQPSGWKQFLVSILPSHPC